MLFVIRYVIDQYKIQETCDKVILKNDGMLMFNDKAVDNYTCGLAFVPNCYKIQKMCNKAIDASPSATEFVPECYKTREICDKAIDAFKATLKFVPNWFVTNKILQKHYDNLDNDINNNNIDNNDKMINNNNVNNMMKMILELLFKSELWFGVIDLNNVKHFKKIYTNN